MRLKQSFPYYKLSSKTKKKLKFNISVTWRAREAKAAVLAHFVVFFILFLMLQSFKNWKNDIFDNYDMFLTMTIFYFTPGGFQYTSKGIFIPKNFKEGEISTKKTLTNF